MVEVAPTRIYQGALPETLFQEVKAVADDLSDSPNYWVPRDIIESGAGATTAETAVCTLHAHIVGPSLPHDWAGAEYWVQVYEGGRGLAFHFDKDEHAMKEEGRMVTPVLSSVLYLTGGGPGESLQAPTVVTDQRFDYDEGCAVPDDPTSSTLVFPRANSYCLFDGCLGHGVLDCGRKEQRATVLVNWWRKKPESVDRVPIKKGSKEEKAKEESKDEAEDILPCCMYPETIDVEEKELGEEGMLMVDDLLTSRGKGTVGEHAVRAVTINHPGLSLYPLDNEQLVEMGGELAIGAALLPCCDEEEEETESDSSE